jgi:hypothetical protein
MKTFNTIHIFGYGETQVIKEKDGKKVSSSELSALQAVIDNVFSKKPEDNAASIAYHAINIFNDLFADFIPSNKDEKSFRIAYSELDAALIEALVVEIDAIEIEVPEKEAIQ